MNNKICYFVVGTEGSGTYMMAEAIAEAGAHYIDEEKKIGIALAKCHEPVVVIRRSLPHRNEWPDLSGIAGQVTHAGYFVIFIAIFRDPNAAIRSVMNRREVGRIKATENMAWSIGRIGELVGQYPVFPITYEAVVGSMGFRYWLFTQALELRYPSNYTFRDENRKYYD